MRAGTRWRPIVKPGNLYSTLISASTSSVASPVLVALRAVPNKTKGAEAPFIAGATSWPSALSSLTLSMSKRIEILNPIPPRRSVSSTRSPSCKTVAPVTFTLAPYARSRDGARFSRLNGVTRGPVSSIPIFQSHRYAPSLTNSGSLHYTHPQTSIFRATNAFDSMK